MTIIKYSKAVLKYEDEDVYVELDARVFPANKDCDVSAVYTYDEWKTSRSKNGSFQKNVSTDESLYRISFLVSHIPRNSRIWFALRLIDHKNREDEYSYWDNNDGINHEIILEKLPQICLPSKDSDTKSSRTLTPQNPSNSGADSLSQLPKTPKSSPSRHSSPPSHSLVPSQNPSPPTSRPSSPPSFTTPPHTPTRKQDSPQQTLPSNNLFSYYPTPCTKISPLAQPFVPSSQLQHNNQSKHSPEPLYQYQHTFSQYYLPQTIRPPQSCKPLPQNPPSLSPSSPSSQSLKAQTVHSLPIQQAQTQKILTPQQLYNLQYKLSPSRKSPSSSVSKPKPTPSQVFIPSDIFPNHSICSMMQGQHRLYDEYIY